MICPKLVCLCVFVYVCVHMSKFGDCLCAQVQPTLTKTDNYLEMHVRSRNHQMKWANWASLSVSGGSFWRGALITHSMHIDDALNMQQHAAVKIKTCYTLTTGWSLQRAACVCATCSSLFRDKLQVKKLISVNLKDTHFFPVADNLAWTPLLRSNRQTLSAKLYWRGTKTYKAG